MWFHSSPGVRALVTAKPVALVINGELQPNELRSNKLTASEMVLTINSVGSRDFTDVAAVVLETNGTLSVASISRHRSGSALEGILTFPEGCAN